MADQALSVVQSLAGSLSTPATEEICLLWSLEDEIERLKSTYSTVQDVLEHTESNQHMSKPIQNWFMKLKYAAYDAENILEEMEIESHSGRADSERCKCASFLKFFYSLLFRFRMAHKVKNLCKTMDAIAEERHKFHLSDTGGSHPRYGVTLVSRETCSLVNESEIWGREQEKEIIIGKLCDKRRLEKDDLSVYAIWGMGGVGKTTLAQLVLNDKSIEGQFDFRIWVCVSENFDVNRILKHMIEYVDRKKGEDLQLGVLQLEIQEKLRGKKFLLVLDDVWNVLSETWETLRSILRRDSKGSAVIVTTRIKPTAIMMATIGLHHIGILSEADSWALFKHRAFPNGEVNETLVQIGEAIVKKCRGLPLAIKALGSLMRSKVTKSEWLSIEKSEIWTLLVDEIPVALKLSYYNLRSDMRKCFAYCCIYPKDYVMEVDELIQLWMANGFLQSSNGQKDLPGEGKKIYEELTWRCFFENNGTNREGKARCKMHDLMHDLAKSIMGREISCTHSFVNDLEFEIPLGLRHASLFNYSINSSAFVNKIQVSTGNSLCSFIAPTVEDLQSDDFYSFLSKQQYLRALYISRCNIRNLDFSCQLKHLKFLFINIRHMETLPESLIHLHNLQTLKFMYSYYLRELPKELRVMKNLCFLEMDSTLSLESTPPEMGKLASLRGLSVFVVGEDALQQIDQLKELKLGGELEIKGLENVKSLEDAKSAKLMSKPDLTGLSLHWKRDCRSEHSEDVLQGLQPHENIERVSISGYPGTEFHEWIWSSAYVKLKSVKLWYCKESEGLPPLGKLPSLTELYINGLDSVKCISAEAKWYGDGKCSFPALTTLSLEWMHNLEEWSVPDSDSVQSFPHLTTLTIGHCPKLKRLPRSLTTLKSLTGLIINDCPQLE